MPRERRSKATRTLTTLAELGIPEAMVVRNRPAQPAAAALAALEPTAEDDLAFALEALGLDAGMERQFFYARPDRQFRADLAWPDKRLLCEVVGGIFTGQAHGSISGVLKDIDRLNTATLRGWRMIRVTPQQVKDGFAVHLIERLLTEWEPRLLAEADGDK